MVCIDAPSEKFLCVIMLARGNPMSRNATSVALYMTMVLVTAPFCCDLVRWCASLSCKCIFHNIGK